MTEEDPLAEARRVRDESVRSVNEAMAALREASLQAKEHINAAPGTQKQVAAQLHISPSVISKLVATDNRPWKPQLEETYAPIDEFTGYAYDLVGLRKRLAIAEQSAAEAETNLARVMARIDARRPSRATTTRFPTFHLPSLPSHFVPRTAKRDEVMRVLTSLAAGPGGTVGVSTAADLHGAGGYGKTTLALDIAHQPEIRELFPDGVAFIEVGPNPPVVTLLSDWASLLSQAGPTSRFSSLDAATTAFMRAIGDRRMLLVLDNVWAPEDLAPFLQGGAWCVRLVTGRRTDLLPPDAVGVDVDRMEPAEALDLLTRDVPGVTAEDVFPLYERSSRWPVVLRLLNGVIRARVKGATAQPVAEIVAALTARLEQAGVSAVDDLAPLSERTAAAVLEISIEDLRNERGGASLLDRFISLAAFPPSALIDFTVLGQLWGCDSLAVATTCEVLAARSLLDTTETTGTRLHDVIHDHLLRSRQTAVRQVNARLVELFRARCPHGEWHRIPPEDEYFLDNLAYHLVNSDHQNELADLVRDLRFVSRRVLQGGPAQLADDIDVCASAFVRDPYLPGLRRVLRFAGHLLTRVSDIRSIAATLHSRVIEDKTLLSWLRETDAALHGGLMATQPMPDRPDPRLMSISVGHEEYVSCVAWRPDGEQLASGSADNTVRLWNSAGSPQRIIAVDDEVDRVAWSPDRLHVAALSKPGTVTLIEPIHGDTTASRPPVSESRGLAWSPEGRTVAVGGHECVLLWDPHRGALVDRLPLPAGEAVRDVAWHPAGRLAALATGGVFYWPDRGSTPRQVPVDLNVPKLLAWSPDGEMLAVGGADRHVALIAAAGTPRVVARSGDTGGWVTALQWSHDGATLACGGDQGEVALWGRPGTGAVDLVPDSREREEWDRLLERHRGFDFRRTRVSSLAWHPRRAVLAVGSHTKDVRLFDNDVPPELPDTVQVNCVRWHPHLPLVAAGTVDGELLFASPLRGADRWTFGVHDQELRSVAFSPDGALLASVAQDRFSLWQFTDDNDLHPLAAASRSLSVGGAVTWSPDGRLVAVGHQGEVILLETSGWTVHARVEVDDLVNSVDIHPTAPYIAISTSSSPLLVHDLDRAVTSLLEGHRSTPGAARWSRSGHALVSVGYDGRVLHWTFDTNLTNATYIELTEQNSPVWDVAMDPTGERAVSVTTAGLIDVIDLQSSQRVQSIAVDSALGCVAMSPDGRNVVAGGASGLYFFRGT